MLPVGHHYIDFHIYADDTQLHVTVDWSNPNVALDHNMMRALTVLTGGVLLSL